jgi:multicomponent Na+:H+ antiporter subunit G
MDVLTSLLLILGIAGEFICCLGLLAARNVYARLHYVSASSIFAVLTGAAVILGEGFPSQAGIKAVLIIITLLVTGPISVHALARAAYRRQAREKTGEML